MEEEKVIMALDLGSQKIKGLIGTKNDKGGLEIKGKGEIDSDSSKSGISGGLIKNLELTSNNIEKVISNAESHFGKKIEEIWIGFSGKHVDGINEHGSVVISGRDHEVTRDDIERVIVQAKTKVEPLPDSRMVIKEIPRWYKIDGEDMIKRPIGMSGKKLGVKMHLIMSNAQQIKNIEKCVNNVGVYLNDTIPNVLASSLSVMDHDASELGCVVIDMGAGTTDISVYVDDALFYTDVMDIGRNIVTRDIAKVLRTPRNKAEKIKKEYGTTFLDDYIDGEETFKVPSVGGRKSREITREELCSIIRPRMEEISDFILKKLKATTLNFQRDLGAGIILTGGMANLHGLDKLMEQIFDLPVIVGKPKNVDGLDVQKPEYASAVGVLKYGLEHYDEYYKDGIFGDFNDVIHKIKIFFNKLFEN